MDLSSCLLDLGFIYRVDFSSSLSDIDFICRRDLTLSLSDLDFVYRANFILSLSELDFIFQEGFTLIFWELDFVEWFSRANLWVLGYISKKGPFLNNIRNLNFICRESTLIITSLILRIEAHVKVFSKASLSELLNTGHGFLLWSQFIMI